MARFASEAELKAFLGKLDADYAEYASALWHEGIKTPTQLANFTEPHYLACGVRRGHIDDIKARADTTGECNTVCNFCVEHLKPYNSLQLVLCVLMDSATLLSRHV